MTNRPTVREATGLQADAGPIICLVAVTLFLGTLWLFLPLLARWLA